MNGPDRGNVNHGPNRVESSWLTRGLGAIWNVGIASVSEWYRDGAVFGICRVNGACGGFGGGEVPDQVRDCVVWLRPREGQTAGWRSDGCSGHFMGAVSA